jgi:hypothetical protein
MNIPFFPPDSLVWLLDAESIRMQNKYKILEEMKTM